MSEIVSDVLNLGILAHVDAGKTSLTERLLFDCGAIGRLGSVDEGTTQTDTGAIERDRGITVRSAVASFKDAGRQYNLVDTPGHTDFVAEVERGLMAVDAVVLVVAAPDGVQPQTRALFRVVRRMRLPTVVFVNKIDCIGATGPELLDDLTTKLRMLPVALGAPAGIGGPEARFIAFAPSDAEVRLHWAERLAEHDDALLGRLIEDQVPGKAGVMASLRAQTSAGLVQPVVFGSTRTGAGIHALRTALKDLVAAPPGRADVAATVFAVERGQRGEKVALVRCFGGALQERQRVEVRQTDGGAFVGRITGLEIVAPGRARGGSLTAGHIARVRGLTKARVGDRLGHAAPAPGGQFPPPDLEVAVRPEDPMRAPALRAALLALADQDPFLRAELGPGGDSIIHLYGYVQQEVLQRTLLDDFGIAADFSEPGIVHVERPVGVGRALEMIGNGFLATVGLRIEPAMGVIYRREVELGTLPVAFHDAVESAVASALAQGRCGWRVTDIAVTMTHCGYWARPYSAAKDFREATPHVLMQALAQAGTKVYEPVHRFWAELSDEHLGVVSDHLGRSGAKLESCTEESGGWLVEGRLALRLLPRTRQRLLSLTNGEGLWTSVADGDQEVTEYPPPTRPRSDGNPFDRAEYLRFLVSRRDRR